MAGINDEVLARRQKDLDGFTEYYQDRLDKVVSNHMKDLGPAWKATSNDLKKEVSKLYREMGALTDPSKIVAAKNKIERLNLLNAKIVTDLGNLGERIQPITTELLTNMYEDGYYMNAWGLEQAAKVAVNVPLLTKSAVLGVVANPWLPDGANYSSRIRANAAYVAEKAKATVLEAVTQGLGVNEAARRLGAVTGEGYFRNVAIVRTEVNRAASLGSSYLFMENADILDSKRWNATLDSRTAPKDADNDKKQYDLDYDTPENPAVPGQRIPNHTNCRCKYSPVLSALGVSARERIAREGDGPNSWGKNTYTKADNYREYAKERGLPDLDERLAKDNPKKYLRPGETMADFNKTIVRRPNTGGTISVAKPYWEEVVAEVKVPQPTTFTAAKTIKEAEEFAKQFAEQVSYSKIDLDVANLVNEELFYQTQANPLPNKFNIIGEMKDVNKYLGETTTKKSVDNIFMQIKSTQDVVDGKPSGPVKAYFAINKKHAGTMEAVNKYIETVSAQGVIKSPTARGLIAHEYGHLIDAYNPVTSWTRISDTLYDTFLEAKRYDVGILEKSIRQNIGTYMLKNKTEFFAEAYRLYTHDILPDDLGFIEDFFKNNGFKKRAGLLPEIEEIVETWADKLKARIAKGVTSEVEVREVGRTLRLRINEYMDELVDQRTILDKRSDEMIAELNNFSPYDYDSKAYKDLNAELRKVRDEYHALGDKVYADQTEKVTSMLREIRPVGPKDANDLQPYIKGSSIEVKEAIDKVRNSLPTSWLEASSKRPMKTNKVKRGFYREAPFKDIAELNAKGYTYDDLVRFKQLYLLDDTIALSGSGESMIRTAFHEMGHRMEDVVPGIKKLEKEFYARRTAGESLRWLGGTYAQKEKARFDKFLAPYMGKDYGNKEDSFYEILSMGLESIFKGSYDLAKDDDYADFIYGILAAL